MNTRKEFMDAVKASKLCMTAKTVCAAYAEYQSYDQDGTKGVWPSQTKIAQEWSMNKNTVNKYVGLLIEAGWLTEIGRVGEADRVYVFALTIGKETDELMNKRKGQSSISYPVGHVSPNSKDMHVLTHGRPSPKSKEGITKNNQENNQFNNQSTFTNKEMPIESTLLDSNAPDPIVLVDTTASPNTKDMSGIEKMRRLQEEAKPNTPAQEKKDRVKVSLDSYLEQSGDKLTSDQRHEVMAKMHDWGFMYNVKPMDKRAEFAVGEVLRPMDWS